MWYLITYFFVMMGVTYLFTKKSSSVRSFIIGDGDIGMTAGAFSIAATWLWAVALLVGSQHAYSSGLMGFSWFLIPNLLVLWLFGSFASRLREQSGTHISITSFIEERYGRKVKVLYLFVFVFIALMSVLVNFFAGGKIISTITGIEHWKVVVALGVIAFAYSQRSGIKASIITDVVQMIIVIAVSLIVVPLSIKNGGGFSVLSNGLSGISREYTGVFSEKWFEVALSFGIPVSITLFSGPFGDNSHWQRAFALKERDVLKSFKLAMLFFGVPTFLMGLVGFMASGTGFMANDASIVAVEFVEAYLPAIITIPFVYMLMSGLMSTVDSGLCSFTSLVADINPKITLKQTKMWMLGLLLVGVIMATIKEINLTILFLTYGNVRASLTLITMLTIKKVKLHKTGVFIGILCSLFIGIPIYLVGSIAGYPALATLGSLLSLLLSGIIALLYSRRKEIHERKEG